MRRAKIAVTGATGFLGRWIVGELSGRGYIVRPLARGEWDLAGVDAVFHLAALCGGIGLNQAQPDEMLAVNARLALDLYDALSRFPHVRAMLVGSVCAYPERCRMPIREEDMWTGYPEPTNAPYGVSKRVLYDLACARRRAGGALAIMATPANLYGPGDHYEPSRSHVIPALIRRMTDAQATGIDSVELWGSGAPTRDFLYVRDAARMLVDLYERGDWSGDGVPLVNLGTGVETSIRELAQLVAKATGYTGQVTWDATRPDGQPRRVLATKRARALGIEATWTLEAGIRETVACYR